ncbi:MAG: Ig-like domain-containing protein, partial [Muribaculaceae bacterium]|nr:Ig-like domain-containing protein [Muribaculaceae bacterium]
QSNQPDKDYVGLNWHPANTYPILSDEGASYTFEDYYGEMIDPLETGWYRISLVDEGFVPENHGQRLVNADAERRQNGTNYYPIRYDLEQTTHPAKEYIHLTVNGSAHRFSSINGHGVKENCTASRTFIPNDGPGVSLDDNGNYILANWHTYPENNVYFLGKSSGKTHSFAFSRVSDEELDQYDIWTVDLTAKDHTEVGKDVSVTLDHSDNKGIATVFNGGKYFLPAGSEITPEQLSFTVQNKSAQALEDPFVRIDPETKTIQIDYTEIPTIPVSSVELDREILTLEVGQTKHLIATVNPADATEQTVIWASSNPAIASVDNEGLVSALSVGDATITASCGGESAQCVVTVNEETIAISEISSGDATKAIYDLQGRKVINPVKGLYIENNKLILK